MDWLNFLIQALESYGYAGAFFTALIGNTVPFLPVPFLIPIFLISGVMDPLPLGVAVGVGATLGKCVAYAVGRGGAAFLGEKKKEELKCFTRALGRYGDLAIFIFSAFPLPDDVIAIPFGLVRYSFRRFFVMLLAGKLFLGLLVAYAGHYSFEIVIGLLGEGNMLLGIVSSLVLVVTLTAVILKINWIEAVEYTQTHGLPAYVRHLMRGLSRSKDKTQH
ncbi:MAG: VTT domain-containing protein [Candidatus Verstraetearchaeota archaeon]|nr:VTT domain-containing protein [Candidatus Verstraetearchaeota archaeon]